MTNSFNSTSTENASPGKYFDLQIRGIGYLNRIREVPPKKGRRGELFLACTIAALNGPSDAATYRYYDVKVSGGDAQHLVRRCKPAVDDGRKVLIEFVLGDPWVDLFTYASGEKAGKPGVCQKARLLFIPWIKIDNKQVYKAARNDDSKSTGDARSETAQEPAPESKDSAEQYDDAESLATAAPF